MTGETDPKNDVAAYYRNSRPEVIALIPSEAKQVLDIGCGAGNLGRALKEARPGISVRGIEIMPGPAMKAMEVLDGVLNASAESAMPDDWPAPDCIVFADVLEHLVDPWGVLRTWAGRLLSGGHVIISVPNATHHTALGQLMRGHWQYQKEGVLDKTHLRFFTRESAIELVSQAGLKITRIERMLNCPFQGEFRRLVRRWVRRTARRESLEGLRPGLRRFILDYSTYQFLIVTQKGI